jgi:hypothetical protein
VTRYPPGSTGDFIYDPLHEIACCGSGARLHGRAGRGAIWTAVSANLPAQRLPALWRRLSHQPYGGYPGYGGGGGVIGNIIDNLIGNRYQVGDRQAIRSCANAAVQRAESDYRPYFGGNLPYAYQGYNGYVRVTAITDVSRRNNGVRVRGLLDTARGGYGNGAYNSDLEFRCDVDYRGYVYNLRISRSRNWR